MKITRWIILLVTALALVASAQTSKDKADKKAPAAASAAASSPSSKTIDINSASADELKSLPGIGEAYSAAIVKNRPYANKRQLVSRKVVPQATYDKIADKIIAKQK